MRLRVLGRFQTVVVVAGQNQLVGGEPGQTIEADAETAAALLRDLPGVVIPDPGETAAEAITTATEATVETEVEMVQVPAEIVAAPRRARTRQAAKPAARKKR